MTLNLSNISSVSSLSRLEEKGQTPAKSQADFANTLKETIENMNHVQTESEVKTEALAKGEIDDLHEVMIAAQKASITVETTVQVQRKMIDAYNEVCDQSQCSQ